MINLRDYLKNKVCQVISAWDEEKIYAISFLVYSNETYEYDGCSNVTEFSVSYNTEDDCSGADDLSEERWNYAFWRQNETPIIDTEYGGMDVLFDWYKENGIENIGYEDYENCYDSEMRYIGKGPVGYIELLAEITAVAKELQESGFIEKKFGKRIPIIIHDFDYAWYTVEATKQANPNGEADKFLAAIREWGLVEE